MKNDSPDNTLSVLTQRFGNSECDACGSSTGSNSAEDPVLRSDGNYRPDRPALQLDGGPALDAMDRPFYPRWCHGPIPGIPQSCDPDPDVPGSDPPGPSKPPIPPEEGGKQCPETTELRSLRSPRNRGYRQSEAAKWRGSDLGLRPPERIRVKDHTASISYIEGFVNKDELGKYSVVFDIDNRVVEIWRFPTADGMQLFGLYMARATRSNPRRSRLKPLLDSCAYDENSNLSGEGCKTFTCANIMAEDDRCRLAFCDGVGPYELPYSAVGKLSVATGTLVANRSVLCAAHTIMAAGGGAAAILQVLSNNFFDLWNISFSARVDNSMSPAIPATPYGVAGVRAVWFPASWYWAQGPAPSKNLHDIALVALRSDLGRLAGFVPATIIGNIASYVDRVYMMGYPNCGVSEKPACCPVGWDPVPPTDADDLALWGGKGCVTKLMSYDADGFPKEAETTISGSLGQSGGALLSLDTPWMRGELAALGVYSDKPQSSTKPSIFTLITPEIASGMASFMSWWDPDSL